MGKPKKHEPIVYEHGNGSIEEFYKLAIKCNFSHIIYVQDCEGGKKCLWATSSEDLLDCFNTFSELYFFGRVQTIERAIKFGFDDLNKK